MKILWRTRETFTGTISFLKNAEKDKRKSQYKNSEFNFAWEK
jgi:hypothetical protein